MPKANVTHYTDGSAKISYTDSGGHDFRFWKGGTKVKVEYILPGPLFNWRLKKRIKRRMKSICDVEARIAKSRAGAVIVRQETVEGACD